MTSERRTHREIDGEGDLSREAQASERFARGSEKTNFIPNEENNVRAVHRLPVISNDRVTPRNEITKLEIAAAAASTYRHRYHEPCIFYASSATDPFESTETLRSFEPADRQPIVVYFPIREQKFIR